MHLDLVRYVAQRHMSYFNLTVSQLRGEQTRPLRIPITPYVLNTGQDQFLKLAFFSNDSYCCDII
jgi:hypothetical protein